MVASYAGHLNCVRELVLQGADINLQRESGTTALFFAAQQGHNDIVRFLFEFGASTEFRTKEGGTALLAASQYGHTRVVETLLKHGANIHDQLYDGATALFLAAQGGYLDVIRLLLSSGAKVNQPRQGRTRSAFLKLKELKKKFKPRAAIVKDSVGKILYDAGSIRRRWKEYTESLYQKELVDVQPFQEVAYDQEPMVLKEEVQAALKALAKNKALGIDGLSIEMFQQTDAALEVLTRLCQEIWKIASWPTDWKRSIFMPLPKKGDPTKCGNYRTISLISHASKILLKIIQKRLQQRIDRELPEIQAGLRRGRGTRDIIADVRWILAESREYQKDIYLCFIDYAKAFDCVDHNKLWITLQRMGIPEHLIVLMRNFYIDQEAVVRTEQGDSDWFKVRKDVCQGCILSPYLFNLYAEKII
ncbi:ankyrin repeat domain-containing protein 29 isoform X2 [Elephas maximus indicus]|nr:ankyrin repeat domain-containing protein 29 isoform X2 [Elephas maximus indicus]